MKRAVWILAIACVLLAITLVTLVQWTDGKAAATYQPEHLTLQAQDKE